MNTKQLKKQLILNMPYIVLGLATTNLGEMWRLAVGANASEKVQSIVLDGLIAKAFSNPLPSLYPTDLLVGIACGAALRLAVYLKGKNAKKFLNIMNAKYLEERNAEYNRRHTARRKEQMEALRARAEAGDQEAQSQLAERKQYQVRATVKSYRKMREDALNGDPIAKERYEKTLAMRREAYHSKKSEQTA